MKRLFILVIFIAGVLQGHSQEAEVRKVIDTFFRNFRTADTFALRRQFIPSAQLMTYQFDSKGNSRAKGETLDDFIRGLGLVLDDNFDERLTGFTCLVDDGIAMVWAPYEFFFDGRFSHCGTNAIQLIKVHGDWKISQITDTRRKTGCYDIKREAATIDSLMNEWHRAAAKADDDSFFGMMTPDAIYIGTDPGERWKRDELRAWSAKYFERESAWDFTPKSRNIRVEQSNLTAWADELLDTWMGPCRSTAILQKEEGRWKIVYYHLSMAIPNENVDGYLDMIKGHSEGK